MSIVERRNPAKLLMAEELSQLGGLAKKWVRERSGDSNVVASRPRQFAELDQR